MSSLEEALEKAKAIAAKLAGIELFLIPYIRWKYCESIELLAGAAGSDLGKRKSRWDEDQNTAMFAGCKSNKCTKFL